MSLIQRVGNGFQVVVEQVGVDVERHGRGLVSDRPASVRYHDRAALLRWFQPEQLDELEVITGAGNVRTVMLTAGTPLE